MDQLDVVYALFPRLKERVAQQAGTLSGGERQMLALGRALMGKPRMLMLDEPSLGLAPRVVREVLQVVAGLRDAGVAVLLVEQNARAALQISDYAYVLEGGRISLEGKAAIRKYTLHVINICMYMFMYIYMCIYIYIFLMYVDRYTHTCVYIYIYTY